MKVMIVDDSAAMRRFLQQQMERLGFDTVRCENGAQALIAYGITEPDIVLMDLLMPGLDGIETTRCIREVDDTAHICMVTEVDDDRMRAHASDAGATRYFLKEQLDVLLAYLISMTEPRDAPVS